MNAVKTMVSVIWISLATFLLNVPCVSGQQASSKVSHFPDFRDNYVRFPNPLAKFQPAQTKVPSLPAGKMFLTGYSAPIRRLQFSADGNTLATLAWDSKQNEDPPWGGGSSRSQPLEGTELKRWDVADGRERLSWTIPATRVIDAAISVDLATVAMLQMKAGKEGDGVLTIFDVAARRVRHRFDVSYSLGRLEFSPDNKGLLCAEGKHATLWDVQSGKKLRTFGPHLFGVSTFAFSADGKQVVCGSDRGEGPCGPGERKDPIFNVKVHRLNDGRLQTDIAGTTLIALGHHMRCGFLTGGTHIVAAAGSDVCLWDTRRGELAASFQAPASEKPRSQPYRVTSLATSPDGEHLAVGYIYNDDASNYQVHVWEVAAGARLATLHGHTDNVRALAFSPDGRFLATGGDRVMLWHLAALSRRPRLETKLICSTRGHRYFLRGLAFAPEGKTLASAEEGSVKLWDVPTLRERAVFRSPEKGIG